MKYPLALAVTLFLSPAVPALAEGDHGHDHGHEAARTLHDAHAAHDGHVDPGHAQPAPAKGKPKTPAKKEAHPAPADDPGHLDSHGDGDHGHAHDAGAVDGDGHGAPARELPKSAKSREASPGHGDAKVRILLKGAVERLKEGNRRFAEGRPSNPRRGRDQRALVAKAQLPFAVVVSCSDSRVPPEILFDQGLGDLFVVRVAGNVVDDHALGSIEYAVEHLGARLIVVLGHERCGAVDAACKGGEPGGHVGSLVREIKPAVEVARRYAKGQAQMLLPTAVRANVERVVDQLKGSWPVLGPEVREGKVTVTGGVYDLEDGLVEFLP